MDGIIHTHEKRSFLREKRKILVKYLCDYPQLVFFRDMVCVKKIENRKKTTKQCLSLLITRLSIACSAFNCASRETSHKT